MTNRFVTLTWPMPAALSRSLAATPATFVLSAAPATESELDASVIGEDAVPINTPPLDDQMLSRQRGGRAGMVMVAATPELMRGGNTVTLWDEIAPPGPLPVPVDAERAAQGNIVSYTRK
jgi:hypothetical protein